MEAEAPVEQVVRFQVVGSGPGAVLVDAISGRTWARCTTPTGQSFSAGQEGWCVLYFEAHASKLDERMFGLTRPEPPTPQELK